jgi:serine/threonine protein kinase/tetratricopeptide (TPR) repeat protein
MGAPPEDELQPDARARSLDEIGARNPEMRHDLEPPLREHVETETVQVVVGAPRHSLAVGESLAGRFRVGRFLGKGGMGEVYEAEDLELGGSLAVKVIRPELLEDPQFAGRFRREVHLARQVTHPNVCRIFDVGYDRGTNPARMFLTMEYLDGEPLAVTLKRYGRMSAEDALPLVRQMTAGLEALHEKGIVHRDIKPGNIMIVRSDSGSKRIVIGDFGLARPHQSDDSLQQLSRSGHIVGTPEYMAPEQLTGKPVTPAADIYALGLVMYEMLTGAKPFAGREAMENAVQRLTEDPAPPRAHAPDLDARWEAVILRCLSREPEGRPARASDIGAALSGAAELAPVHTRDWRTVSPRGWAGLAVAVAVLSVLSISVWRFPGWPGGSGARLSRQHVAVLPLNVIGGDAALRVFADGLMETMTIRLSQFEQGENSPLLVVPASEVRQQAAKSAGDAAKKFGATSVVEGSVQSQDERMRLLLTVVDTREMRQMATMAIDEHRANAWSLQDAAVARIANALNVRVQAQHAREAAPFTPAVPGAYEYYLQARGYLQRSDRLDSIENAIAVARRALELDTNYAGAHAAVAEAYWHKFQLTRDQQWIEQALTSCRRALELDSNLPEAHVTMGLIHLGTGRYDEARQDYERALAADARSHGAYQGLADAYFQQKQFDKAEATHLKAISMRPGDWTGYKQLGLYYYRRGELEKAQSQYQTLVKLTPDNAQGYVNLGVVQARLEKTEDAKRSWHQALLLDPERVSTLTNLGKLHYDLSEYQRAIEFYERAVKLNPRSFLLWGSLGMAHLRAGTAAPASEALNKAIQLAESELRVNPKRADLYSYIGFYQASLGRRAEVDGLLRRALELNAADSEIIVRAAEAYALIGSNDRAAALVKEALSGGYPPARLRRSVPLRDITRQLAGSESNK